MSAPLSVSLGAAFTILVMASPLSAEERSQRLAGTYALGGRTLIDPPAGEARNTHLYIVLEGSSARDVYRAMNADAVRDACLDDGSLTKSVGAMQCTEAATTKRYSCAFAIDIAGQKIEGGAAC